MASEDDCSCLLCGCTSLTSVLYDINGNSVLIDSTLLDLEDILFSLFNRTINSNINNYICEDCKDQLVKFHLFKENAKMNLQAGCFENAITELREFLNKHKDKEEGFELECTDTEFVIRVKTNDMNQYVLEEFYEETEEASQISEEFIETETEKQTFANTDVYDTDQIMQDETDMFVKTEDEAEVRIIVDSSIEEVQKVYSCNICEINFLKEIELKHHKLKLHALNNQSKKSVIQQSSQFACDSCNITFKDEKYSKIHQKAHQSFTALIPHLPSFCCEECLVLFSNEEDLLTHGSFHDSKVENVDHCLIERISAFDDHFIKNDQLITDEDNMIYHQEEQIFSCGHCGIRKSENDMKLHLLFFHTTMICCPIDHRCFEGHKQVRQFAEHIKNKHPEIFDVKVDYVCTCCGEKFSTPFEKLAHMKKCDMKKFICDRHCGKRFKSEWLLKKHLSYIESGGDKRFSCSLCPKQCVSKSDLQIHMRSHTNERPYICTICNKAFKTSANRSSHMDIHREDKIHECKVCQQKFQTRPILRKHMKKHDEDYQNQCICQICKHKSYINRTHLLRHIKSSHSQPDLTIDRIDDFFQEYFANKES
ncbi:hypothetical protein PVAND_000928 [Polypedilum vanderplanki]|uniref:C2H2-type domain-containing protein n=1 Tax=Polypedilum vanderplanki TaxID=319348 RepID=A0A9J6BLT1_POLVA|nr:hypothetical protein PVAND_000928 [Polypedilum vanderplanki]